jgi:hypothetical protein
MKALPIVVPNTQPYRVRPSPLSSRRSCRLRFPDPPSRQCESDPSAVVRWGRLSWSHRSPEAPLQLSRLHSSRVTESARASSDPSEPLALSSRFNRIDGSGLRGRRLCKSMAARSTPSPMKQAPSQTCPRTMARTPRPRAPTTTSTITTFRRIEVQYTQCER